MSWQPIGTAPKDREILLRISQRHLALVYTWCRPEYVTVGRWCQMQDDTGTIEGWGEVISSGQIAALPYGVLLRGEPVEWHEIPKPNQ